MRHFPCHRARVVGLSLLVCLLLPPGARAQQAPAAPASTLTETMASEHEVELKYLNRPITTLRARVLSTMPAQRASAAVARIDQLVETSVTGPASWRIVNGVLFISVGGRDVFSLLPADLNTDSEETLERRGAEAAERLSVALGEAQEARRPGRLSRSIALALAATLALIAIVFAARRLHRRAAHALAAIAERELDRVGSRSWWTDRDLLISRLARILAVIALAALSVIVTYMWASFVLRQFPYTRPWGEALRNNLFAFFGGLALNAAQAVPGLLVVVVIIVATRAAIGMSNAFFDGVERGRIALAWASPDTARASRRLAATALWLFALALAYPYLPGSGTEAFKGVSVFVGLVLSLGSSGLVNQLISGFTLTYSQALRVGEVIRTGDVEGRVTRLGLFSVQVRTAQDELVTAPNAVVLGQTTTNYSRLAPDGGTILSTEVTIGYNTPWRQVHALLILAAERTDGVMRTPRPRVWQRALEDFYIRYRLVIWTRSGLSKAETLDALLANIQDAFNEHAVQIMSPNYEADPERPAVVAPENWYAPPAVPPLKRRAGS